MPRNVITLIVCTDRLLSTIHHRSIDQRRGSEVRYERGLGTGTNTACNYCAGDTVYGRTAS
jgi:hypothetical protein